MWRKLSAFLFFIIVGILVSNQEAQGSIVLIK